jgi:ASC-1-like (ASCH) protein
MLAVEIILYFNLPYNPIIKERIQPVRIYPKMNSANIGGGERGIQDMLEAFETKQNQVRQANVIIMKVEADDKDRAGGGQGDDMRDNCYIVGGYASHGWSAKFPLNGDESSFLFNLTQNLRFNAVKGQRHYQVTDVSDQNSRRIKFGDTDLIIENDFSTVTSVLKGTHFAFGSQLYQKNRIDSVIPGKKKFNPIEVEVWSFDLKNNQ